jgi:hypothetical protein
VADNPIFVVGFQRSGTTLLQSLLGAHSRIAAPPEMHFIFRIVRLASVYGDLANDENMRRALHDTLNPPARAYYASTGFDEERIFRRAHEGERTMRGLLAAVLDDFAQQHGKARWAEKTPGQRASDALKLFPEAQIVHIVRDPRDAISSALTMPWTREDAATLADQWRTFTIDNSRCGLLAGPARVLQLRYEDLARDPDAALRMVMHFLGESFEPDAIGDAERRRGSAETPWQQRVLDPVSAVEEGTWRSKLSRRDQFIVQALLHRELAAFGYAPASRRAIALGTVLALRWRASRSIGGFRARYARRAPRDIEAQTRQFLEQQARSVADYLPSD